MAGMVTNPECNNRSAYTTWTSKPDVLTLAAAILNLILALIFTAAGGFNRYRQARRRREQAAGGGGGRRPLWRPRSGEDS